MPAHEPQNFQHVERIYRIVAVDRRGNRTVISEHDSYLQAERRRQTTPSEENVDVRIETSIKN